MLKEATPAQLQQAVANNHKELFCLNAQAQGGAVKETTGLTYTCAGKGLEAMVAFPALNENNAAVQLDEMMAWYRQHLPKSIGCWSLDPPQPADIGIRLLARGFQPGWLPYWMALDLEAIQTTYPTPDGLEIHPDNSTSLSNIKELPYAGSNGAVSPALIAAHPERVQRFVATLHGKIVAQSCVFFTTGENGVAGLYNVGVVPPAREQGIGKAVVLAACQYAKTHGYRYAVLNGTGRRMYEQVGFKWIGDGRTWWLMNQQALIHPPTPEQVAIAEAVGRGDISTLQRFEQQLSNPEWQGFLANDMTLVQLAVHCGQPAAAGWLAEHHLPFTVLDAWDLHWEEKAAALLAADPQEVNRQYGTGGTTLLHTAAERNDTALARLAISAKPHLEIKDKIYNSTPLGWAQYMGRTEITKIIQQYAESK